MQRQVFHPRTDFIVAKTSDGLHDSQLACMSLGRLLPAKYQNHNRFVLLGASIIKNVKCSSVKTSCSTQASEYKVMMDENEGLSEDDEEDELCPVECVREFKTDQEFFKILEKAKETDSLVVVDFYRTSCGSCKYIEQGFSKLCKGSGDKEAPIIFLKHNVSSI